MCTLPLPLPAGGGGGWGGGEPKTKLSKGRGLKGSQSLKGDCWKRGGDFFQGGCSFYIKNKLKPEIFNDEKSL